MVIPEISPPAKQARRATLEFEVMCLLGKDPALTQRDIAGQLQASIGRINYCMKALIERGVVKPVRQRSAGAMRLHGYELTQKGLTERLSLAGAFLQRKIADFERLRGQIEDLRQLLRIESES